MSELESLKEELEWRTAVVEDFKMLHRKIKITAAIAAGAYLTGLRLEILCERVGKFVGLSNIMDRED